MLVIRGELLKKYPTAVIYAHRAEWQRDDDGDIDPAPSRACWLELDAAPRRPTRRATRCGRPLYEARSTPTSTSSAST